MNFLRLLTTAALGLLAAFAHAAKVGELPLVTSAEPRIAVYLDCSDSMAPYLPAVEAEIRKKFPDADVFSVPAIKVWVEGNVVRGGGPTALPHRPAATGPRVSVDASRMTPVGRELLARYAGNFETGSVGAWIDILRREKRYAALVIFSDFNDQVLQTRAGAGQVYVEDAGQRGLPEAEIADTRTVAEKVWEDSWVGSFELAAPARVQRSTFSRRVIRRRASCRNAPKSRAANSRSSTGSVPTARLVRVTEARS